MSDLRTGTFPDGTVRFFALIQEGDRFIEIFHIRTAGLAGLPVSDTRTGNAWPTTTKGWSAAKREITRKNMEAKRWDR